MNASSGYRERHLSEAPKQIKNNMKSIGNIFLKLAVLFGASAAATDSAPTSGKSAAAKKKTSVREYSHCGCMDGDKIHVVKMMDSFDSEPTLMQMCSFHIAKATAAGKVIQMD